MRPIETFEVEGRMVAMPVEVRRARNWIATYTVDSGAAAALVAPTGLEVATMRKGRAIATIGFVSYDDTDLGAYHEFMLSILVRRHDGRGVGVYVHRLPVDDAFSMAAGRGIWGYPKTIMSFEHTAERGADTWTLSQNGAQVLSARFRSTWFPMPRQKTPPTYTLMDGVVRLTSWSSSPRGMRARPGGVDVTLGSGEIADELRSLGLPRKALASIHTARMRASFGASQVVERAAASR
jgi:hypothetical protein